MTYELNAERLRIEDRLFDMPTAHVRHNYEDALNSARRWDMVKGYEATWARYMMQTEAYRAELQRRGVLNPTT